MIPNYERPQLVAQKKTYRAERKAAKRKDDGKFKRTRAQVRVIVFDRESGRCERCDRKVSFDVAPYADDHAEVNEPGLRSRGADPLDPDQCELVCHQCHFGGPSGAHAPTKERMKDPMRQRRTQPDCYEYVRNYYHVPAYVGVRVKVRDREGVLVAPRCPNQYVYVLFDGDTKMTGPFHPDDHVTYHPVSQHVEIVATKETNK